MVNIKAVAYCLYEPTDIEKPVTACGGMFCIFRSLYLQSPPPSAQLASLSITPAEDSQTLNAGIKEVKELDTVRLIYIYIHVRNINPYANKLCHARVLL